MIPIAVRAHNLLCLIGFEGCGYSERFVENMTAIKSRLWSDSHTPVKILVEPDDICAACPNLKAGACHLRGQSNEAHMRGQDQDVAARLGIEPGHLYAFSDLMDRITDSIEPKDLDSICGACPWLSSGVCKKALKEMKAA